MKRVEWTESAESDLDSLISYVSEESIQNAVAMDIYIRDRVRILADFQELGKSGRFHGTHELVIPQYRCVVIYEIEDETVAILRVIHGGQEWPMEF